MPQAGTRNQRQYFNIGGRPADLPFTDGVLVDGTLYLSGRIGLDPKTGKAPTDRESEARLMLDGVRGVLERAGMTMDDLVFVQIYCTDLSLFELFNRVYRSYFKKEFPARAFLGAGSLVLGAHFEIQAIAVKS